MAKHAKVSQLGTFFISSDYANDAKVAELGALVVHTIPAEHAQVHQLGALLVYDTPTPEVAQMGVLALYNDADTVDIPNNAWGFTFDGHPFYVLSLESQGTFVYDIATQQWSEWKTEGYNGWNMRNGTTWRGNVVAGAIAEPTVWRIDANVTLDEGWRNITRIVTGGYPMRARNSVGNYALSVAADVGYTLTEDSQGETYDDSTIRLRFSDDNGVTWYDAGTLAIPAGEYKQELAWRSLGRITAPGRVFELTDVGGLVRIDDVDVAIEGEDDEGADNS